MDVRRKVGDGAEPTRWTSPTHGTASRVPGVGKIENVVSKGSGGRVIVLFLTSEDANESGLVYLQGYPAVGFVQRPSEWSVVAGRPLECRDDELRSWFSLHPRWLRSQCRHERYRLHGLRLSPQELYDSVRRVGRGRRCRRGRGGPVGRRLSLRLELGLEARDLVRDARVFQDDVVELRVEGVRPRTFHRSRRSGGHARTVMMAARITQINVATMSPGIPPDPPAGHTHRSHQVIVNSLQRGRDASCASHLSRIACPGSRDGSADRRDTSSRDHPASV